MRLGFAHTELFVAEKIPLWLDEFFAAEIFAAGKHLFRQEKTLVPGKIYEATKNQCNKKLRPYLSMRSQLTVRFIRKKVYSRLAKDTPVDARICLAV